MSSGLQRRRVAGGGGENSTTISPSSSRPELANQKSYSGRSSPAGNNRNEGINTIDQQDSDHRIAFDPRDMEEGQEREKFPKLTMMEEVLLLGLKDKQVRYSKDRVDIRDTCHSGMTTFLTRYGDVFYWNWLSDREYPCRRIQTDEGSSWPID